MSRFYAHPIQNSSEISSTAKARASVLLEDLDRVVTSLMLLKSVHDGNGKLHELLADSIRNEAAINIAGSDIDGLAQQAPWLNAVADLLAPLPPLTPDNRPADEPVELGNQGQKHIDALTSAIASIEAGKPYAPGEVTPYELAGEEEEIDGCIVTRRRDDIEPDDLDAYDGDETRPDVNDA